MFFSFSGVRRSDSGGFTTTQWTVCISVVTIVILVTIAMAVFCYRKRRRDSATDGGSDTRSDNPTVMTSVTDAEQYHVGPYPFGDLPDLPSSAGMVPNTPPDLLEGAVGPAVTPPEHQENMINKQKEGVPPPLYDQAENDDPILDSKPPPYSP